MRHRRALAALAGATLTASCLLPQEDNILVDLPPPLNQPPRIVEDQVRPGSLAFTIDGGAGCPDLTFVAPVEDPDLGDVLFYDFYVDPGSSSSDVLQGIISPSGGAVRAQAATYTVSFDGGSPTLAPGLHLVEVLVADGPLVNRLPQPRTVPLPDGGTRIDPTFVDTHVWQVTVAGAPCP